MKEIWKDIPSYEGLYQVSNLGRFKALARIRISSKGERSYKEKLLSPKINFDKYYYVSLTKEGKKKSYRAHRLVALAFLGPCPISYVIDHIDGNSLNNNASNLRYVTQLENIQNPNTIKKSFKRVIQLSLDNKELNKFPSIKVAAAYLGIADKWGTHIGQCCKGIRNTAYGYKWIFNCE